MKIKKFPPEWKYLLRGQKGESMKKLVLVIAVFFISMIVLNAVPEYEDVKIFLDKQIKTFEVFIKNCEGVTDAKSAAAAIAGFTKDFRALMPEIKALSTKYKDLQGMMKTNPPAELAPHITKMEEMAKNMSPAMMKIMQYAQDPEVMKAQQDFQKLMMELNKLNQVEKEAKEEQEGKEEKEEKKQE
jgi:hypothetical protein